MIAGGDDRCPGAQKIDRDLSGNPSSAGRVLTVDDDEIQRMLFLQFGQPGDHGVAARLTYDIAQKKNC